MLIKGRGGLVEDEDLGVLDEGAGDGDALLLTARELAALRAAVLVEALVQDELAIWAALLVNSLLLKLLESLVDDVLSVEGQIIAYKLRQLVRIGDALTVSFLDRSLAEAGVEVRMLAQQSGDAAEHRVTVAEHREDVIELLPPLEANDDVLPARAILLHRTLDRLLEAFRISVGLLEELITAVLQEIDQGLLDKLVRLSKVRVQLRDCWGIFGLKHFKCSLEVSVKSLFLLSIGQRLSRGVLNELDGIGFLCSDVHLFVSGIRLAKQDVLLDGRVEKHWLLHDIAALLTQSQHVIVVKILAIDQYLTLINVVEAQQDVGQG